MRCEYRKVKLADLTTTGKGTYGIAASGVEKNDNLYTYLRITDINDDGTLNQSDMKSVADDDAAQYLLKPNDIVFARTGGSTGRNYFYDGKDGTFVYAGFLIKFSIDPLKVNPKYIKYYCQSDVYKNWVRSFNTGSTRGNINAQTFGNMEIPLPPREQQDYLVSVLEPLDEKIATNRAINDNLYHLLSLSFKNDYWDKAIDHPEWIMTTLDETTSRFGTGLNPRKNFVLGHGNNYYVTIKNMGNNRIYLDERCDKIDDEAIRKIQMRSDLKVGDLLFSGIGTIGRVFLIDKPATNWNTSESVFNLRPNAKVSSEFLYLLLLNNDMQDYAISLASGSVQKGIRMADLKKYSFFLPTSDVIKRLTSLWKPLIKQIKANEVESDSLAVLRDTLLPKLMSGEIDVSSVLL